MNQEKFAEWLESQGLNSYDEALEKFLQQVSENIDPRDYMTPTQKEIANLPADELAAEYKMVQDRISTRSASQRKFITQRYEHEQNAIRNAAAEQDSTNA